MLASCGERFRRVVVERTLFVELRVRLRFQRLKQLALNIVLLLATSPVAAQVATSLNQQQQPLGASGRIVTSPLPNTGIICTEEMTATFCNMVTGPNTSGYGARGASGSSAASGSSSGSGSSGGADNAASSIPSRGDFPLVNELCD